MGERYVVLGSREPRKRRKWELLYIAVNLELAFRTAQGIESQQRLMGDAAYRCLVVKESNYDRGRLLPVEPPNTTVEAQHPA